MTFGLNSVKWHKINVILYGFLLCSKIIQDKSVGGLAIPFSQVKNLVKERIIFEYKKTDNNHIPSIHHDTLHDYVSKIVAQNIFNINVGKIPYKTKSRSTAEWT